ncbi:DoxX family protein [Arcticibacter sp. MXS-1]|uniref:DoxX family protein n=1 Tax=Arcticibacter sp. MXS-1 TaxID=3341726 RepID=UPI0035A8F876
MKYAITSVRALSLDAGLLLLRFLSGAAMLTHGWAKLQNVLQGKLDFGDPIGLGTEFSLYFAIFAEFACSLLLIIGFLTRVALAALIVTMVVAFFIVHANDLFGVKELAFLYLSIFAALFLTGPGKYSLDYKM